MGKRYLVYNNQLWEPYKSFEYTGQMEEFTLQPGTYLFVADGARGGRAVDGNPFVSFGGSTYGILDLDHTQKFYAVVGGDGEDSNIGDVNPKGGYNGGGNGGLAASRNNMNGCGGGGATDVRLSNVPDTIVEERITVPDGFYQVEYLESHDWPQRSDDLAGSYIETDYKIKAKARLEIVFEIPYFDSKAYYDNERLKPSSEWKNYYTHVFIFGSWYSDHTGGGGGMTCRPFDHEVNMHNVNWNRYEPLQWANNQCDVIVDIPGMDHVPEDTKLRFVIEPYSKKMQLYNHETGELLIEAETPDEEIVPEPIYTVYDGRRKDCSWPMFLFACGYPGYIGKLEPGSIGKFKMYSVKIWEDGKLIHDYIPFTSTDLTDLQNRGMYDLIDQRFWRRPDTEVQYPEEQYFDIGPIVAEHDMSYVITKKIKTCTGAMSRILVAGGGGGTSLAYNTGSVLNYDGTDVGGYNQDFSSFGGGEMSSRLIGPPTLTTANHIDVRAQQNSGYRLGIGEDAQDRYHNDDASSANYCLEGQGGGGGGWYGGYAINGVRDYTTNYSAQGGTGGSSYILTASSYKPEGYMEGFEDVYQSLYFRNGMMRPYQAFDGARLVVYKVATSPPLTNDKIIIPFTGVMQHATLIPGKYKIACYGGDGATRYDTLSAAKGGYVESIFNLPEERELYFSVGSTPFLIANATVYTEFAKIFGSPYYYRALRPQTGTSASQAVKLKAFATSGGGAVDVRLIDPDGSHPVIVTVPDGLDEYETITTNGTQACQYAATSFSTQYDLEIICEITDTGAQQCLFGSYGSSSKRLYNAFGIFPVWDPADPQTGFMYHNAVTTNGSLMPFNQKIRITTKRNVLSWYDMEDNLLGSITAPYTGTFQTSRYPYIFDCCEGSNQFNLLGANFVGTLYSFKMTFTNASTGVTTIRGWWIPYGDPNDTTNEGLYDLYSTAARKKVAGGDPFDFGDVVAEKTELEKSTSNATLSRNSRIVVAGGGGGQGSPIGFGGAGGGVEGQACQGTATRPSNRGPGTQTTGANFESASAGGCGAYSSGVYYCGDGGYGWYGGYGSATNTIPRPIGADENRGGSGGSGYVLTATTKDNRPTGGENIAPEEKYWMRDEDVVNIQGGNPVRGMTRIEITPIAISVLVIAEDDSSYKAYDTETNTWYDIDVDELTTNTFVTYGVELESIISDTNLNFPYRIYVCNQMGLDLHNIYSYVIPYTQHVRFTETLSTPANVKDILMDCRMDDNVDIELDYSATGEIVNLDISFIPSIHEPTVEPTVYSVELKMTKKDVANYHPEPTPGVYGIMALCNTKNKSEVPSGYKPYIGDFMPDGSTPITSVNCTVACSNDRDIYIAATLNDAIIRIVRYNIIEDSCYLVRDNIARNLLSNSTECAGSLLFKNNKLYLTNSFVNNENADIVVLEIPIDINKPIKKYASSVLGSTSHKESAYGQACWWNTHENYLMFRSLNGHMTFNVITHTWEFYEITDVSDPTPVNSFALGEHSIIEFPYDTDATEPYIFSNEFTKETDVPEYGFATGYKWVCYNDEKFYVVAPGYLYILEDWSSYPRMLNTIRIPDNELQPKSITYSEGILYITFINSNKLYMYDINHQEWLQSTLPFTTSLLEETSWTKPAVFKGYFFIGNEKLYVTNGNLHARYRVSYAILSQVIPTNSKYPREMTYNQRFITLDEVGMHFHPGNIVKSLSQVSGAEEGILISEDYLRTDYKKLYSHSFTEEV